MVKRNSYNTAGLQCPDPLDIRKLIKFIDPGRIGITLGSRILGCLCHKGFFQLIENYFTTSIKINPNETTRIELGNIANYGYRREIQSLDISKVLISSDSSPELKIQGILGTLEQIRTVSFKSSENVDEFIKNFRDVINNDDFLRNNFEINNNIDKDDKKIYLRAKETNTNLIINLSLGTEAIPSSLIRNAVRYPNGRCMFLFIICNYDEFTDPIPDSNQKHLLYAFDDEYKENQIETENINWRTLGKLYANSSDEDITEDDENLIETIWIKNPLKYAVNLQVMIAS